MSEPSSAATSGTTDRRRQRGAKSRQKVLEHAAAIASVDGLEGLTIGRLAAEAGVGKGNIQVLFGDKEALQLATIDWVSSVYTAAIAGPAVAEETSPLARLTAMVRRWFDFVERRELPGGCFMNAVSSEFRARPGRIRDRLAKQRAEKRDRYVAAIRSASEAGEIDPDVDAEQVAFELLAFQALANVAVTIGDDQEFERARRTSFDRLEALQSDRGKNA